MTNPHYNVTGVPTPRSRGRSDLIREEYADIEAGFDSVEAELQARVTVVEPTTTGTMTHTGGAVDFDAATQVLVPTVTPAGDNTKKAASTEFVQTAIGSVPGAMPPQAGNGGSVMATDGTTNYWQGGGIAGIAFALYGQGVV